MAITDRNVELLHTPAAQQMAFARLATAANMFVVGDPTGRSRFQLHMTSATVHYLYGNNNWHQIPSGAFATFAVGACGVFHPWSNTYTANGGSTTSVTVAAATHNITGLAIGETIEFASSGTNSGLRRKITGLINNAGTGNITIQFAAVPTAVLTGNTFRIATGRFFVYSGGVTVAGSFKSFDIATMSWSGNLAITGLPTFANDGRMAIAYQLPKVFDTGTATSAATNSISDTTKKWKVNQFAGNYVRITTGTGANQALVQVVSNTATAITTSTFTVTPDATSVYSIEDVIAAGQATSGSTTTLVNSAKTWAVNQWTNFRVRITGGTGLGQNALITSNTATTLTFPALATAPDSTSLYEIEGDENSIYLTGNGAVAMYKNSISANTWATVAPTTARAVVPGASPSLNSAYYVDEPNWANESDNLNGRYLYSFRGNGSGICDRFDIAGGTAGAGAWLAVNFTNGETFTTGASFTLHGGKIFVRKESALNEQLFFIYYIPENYIRAWFTLNYPDGAAVAGNKIWTRTFGSFQSENKADSVIWVYSLQSSGRALHRVPCFQS
jgi:hypothetical protein